MQKKFPASTSNNQGFTLLEMMMVVGILGAIAGVVFYAIKPQRYFAGARNIQRRADLERIQGAVNHYSIERNGALPSLVSSTLQMIGTATSGCNVSCGNASTSASCVNLGSALSPFYIESFPIDPTVGTAAKTYYAVQKMTYTGTGLRIRACSPELSQSIEITQ